MKLKLDRKGLSPLVAVIVLLTLVMVLGAIIAGTLSGAPRPVLPATTAVNIMTPFGGNPAAGDQTLVIRHEYGAVIDDAWTTADGETIYWCEMELLVNGEVVYPTIENATSNGAVITQAELRSIGYKVEEAQILGVPICDIEPPEEYTTLELVKDFALGDQIWIELPEGQELQSSDLIQLVYVPRDLMLVEYLVQ